MASKPNQSSQVPPEPQDCFFGGPGWIRTNHTQNDDSGRLAPRSDPQGSESTETAGVSPHEPVGLPNPYAAYFFAPEPLPFDDPPEDAGDSGGAKGSRSGLRVEHPPFTHELYMGESPREPAPQISLDDRFSIAIAARGSLSICNVIVLATGAVQPYGVRDEDLVELLEAYVFRGERV